MTFKAGKLTLLLVGIALMMRLPCGMADEAADVVSAEHEAVAEAVPSGHEATDVVPAEREAVAGVVPSGHEAEAMPSGLESTDVAPTPQEKAILSTILKSFKNGQVDLATLASVLNDPNVNRLAASLNKANMTKLAAVLEEPHIDLSKLVAALSDPGLNLDKIVATFGDSKVLPSPHTLQRTANDAGILAMMKRWASKIGETFKASPAGGSKKRDEKLSTKASTQATSDGNSGIPTGFERSTPGPDANTYGKSIMSGVEVTPAKADYGDKVDAGAELSVSQSTFDNELIYYAVAGVLGLSMCIFLAARYAKSYGGPAEVEETRSTVRLVV